MDSVTLFFFPGMLTSQCARSLLPLQTERSPSDPSKTQGVSIVPFPCFYSHVSIPLVPFLYFHISFHAPSHDIIPLFHCSMFPYPLHGSIPMFPFPWFYSHVSIPLPGSTALGHLLFSVKMAISYSIFGTYHTTQRYVLGGGEGGCNT